MKVSRRQITAFFTVLSFAFAACGRHEPVQIVDAPVKITEPVEQTMQPIDDGSDDSVIGKSSDGEPVTLRLKVDEPRISVDGATGLIVFKGRALVDGRAVDYVLQGKVEEPKGTAALKPEDVKSPLRAQAVCLTESSPGVYTCNSLYIDLYFKTDKGVFLHEQFMLDNQTPSDDKKPDGNPAAPPPADATAPNTTTARDTAPETTPTTDTPPAKETTAPPITPSAQNPPREAPPADVQAPEASADPDAEVEGDAPEVYGRFVGEPDKVAELYADQLAAIPDPVSPPAVKPAPVTPPKTSPATSPAPVPPKVVPSKNPASPPVKLAPPAKPPAKTTAPAKSTVTAAKPDPAPPLIKLPFWPVPKSKPKTPSKVPPKKVAVVPTPVHQSEINVNPGTAVLLPAYYADSHWIDTSRNQVEGTYGAGRLISGIKISDIVNPTYFFTPASRAYGTELMYGFLSWLGIKLKSIYPGHRLRVTDISKAGGGPLRPHKSHQIGLEADISYLTDHDTSSMSVVNGRVINGFKRALNWTLLKHITRVDAVNVVFVGPMIRKNFCAYAAQLGESRSERNTLRRLYPLVGHDNHFHVQLKIECGKDEIHCRRKLAPLAPSC